MNPNRLSIKVSTDSSTAISIENYEIQISRSDFRSMLTCICRVSFLTTLDIYKTYFQRPSHKKIQGEHMQKVTDTLFSLKEVTASFAP